MIGVGIVGCNYGRTVLIPVFRDDPRCEVIALAGTDAERTAEFARAANVARGLGHWRALVEQDDVAVAIAVPPDLQPAIAQYALKLGKPVFLEKPLAANVTDAKMIVESARGSGCPTIIDFNFPELPVGQTQAGILQAITDLGLDPARCAIVGDKVSDIEAGAAAGVGLRILLRGRDAGQDDGAPSHEVVADLAGALELLRSHFAGGA